MEIGVSVPIVEIGPDLGAVREFVQASEELGYTHARILEHTLGAQPESHPEVPYFAYTHESCMHEPFVLMGYLAGITTRIIFQTGILILPQRQTALVAKQAAEVDLLSGGRLRLGVGVGWNPVEYEALSMDFHTRGEKINEQIQVLRALWTQEIVNFDGKWHTISAAGINPLPIQRPIPIWFGTGTSRRPAPPDAAIRRVAQLGDGWMPIFNSDEAGREMILRMRHYAAEAGRDAASIALEGRINAASGDPDDWAAQLASWTSLGATHIAIATGGLGQSAEPHINLIRQVKQELGF